MAFRAPLRPARATRHDPSRQAWMDASRGVAVLLVIIGHAVFARADESPEALLWLVDFFRPFRIPTLLLLSGLLVHRGLQKSTRQYLDGKWRSVLWPFIGWNIFIWVLMSDPPPLWSPIVWLQPGHLWFLLYLCGYYLIALALRGRHPVVPLLLLAVCWALTYGEVAHSEFFRYGMYFFTGAWIGTALRGKLRPPSGAPTLLACGAIAVTFGVLHTQQWVDYRNPLAMLPVLAGIATIVGLCALVSQRFEMRFLTWLGRNSLIFYVTHFPVVAIMAVLQLVAWPDHGAWYWLPNLVVALAVCSFAVRMQTRWFATLPYRAPFGLTPPRARASVATA